MILGRLLDQFSSYYNTHLDFRAENYYFSYLFETDLQVFSQQQRGA
jgi:hypothetical protein